MEMQGFSVRQQQSVLPPLIYPQIQTDTPFSDYPDRAQCICSVTLLKTRLLPENIRFHVLMLAATAPRPVVADSTCQTWGGWPFRLQTFSCRWEHRWTLWGHGQPSLLSLHSLRVRSWQVPWMVWCLHVWFSLNCWCYFFANLSAHASSAPKNTYYFQPYSHGFDNAGTVWGLFGPAIPVICNLR